MKVPGTNFHCALHRQQHTANAEFWRLYIIRKDKIDGQTKRTIVYKTTCNYTLDGICDIMRSIGDPLTQYAVRDKDRTYCYEAYQRLTRFNRTY